MVYHKHKRVDTVHYRRYSRSHLERVFTGLHGSMMQANSPTAIWIGAKF